VCICLNVQDGLYGVVIVNPLPTSPQLPYHNDEWLAVISDFYAFNARDINAIYFMTPLSDGSEPIPNAIQVNNIIGTSGTSGRGLRFVAQPRGKTLIRFVAANGFSVYNISIDGVIMNIVEIDGTAVEPLAVTWFNLNIGQRVAVLVDWTSIASTRGNSAIFMRVRARAELYASPLSYIPPYEKVRDE
jgi:FtsP/CotA-like multicopper oxidase with cupredoxin domain